MRGSSDEHPEETLTPPPDPKLLFPFGCSILEPVVDDVEDGLSFSRPSLGIVTCRENDNLMLLVLVLVPRLPQLILIVHCR